MNKLKPHWHQINNKLKKRSSDLQINYVEWKMLLKKTDFVSILEKEEAGERLTQGIERD